MYKNANQTKTNQQNKSKRTKNNKGNNFLGIKNSDRGKIGYFALWYFLYAQNLFVKKIDWLEVVLIASFTILLKRVKNLVAFEQVIVPTLNKSKNCSSDFEQVKNLLEQVKNLLFLLALKNLLVILLALNKLKVPFGETPWLTGRHATPLVTLFFGVTMLLTGRHAMPVVI